MCTLLFKLIITNFSSTKQPFKLIGYLICMAESTYFINYRPPQSQISPKITTVDSTSYPNHEELLLIRNETKNTDKI